MTKKTKVAIIGAGPIGLEMAVALKKAGIDYEHFDKGQIGNTITWFPDEMTFFSSPERIAICNIPIPSTNQGKTSKENYLAYLRMVVQAFDLQVRTYEEVVSIRPRGEEGFLLQSKTLQGTEHETFCEKLILVTGDMHRPHLIGVPGENRPQVSHYFRNPHVYFRKKLVVVGGRNSAVEAAVRSWRCGADVTLCHLEEELSSDFVKYWILPEIQGCIKRGEIKRHARVKPREIREDRVVFERIDCDETLEVEADFVLLMTGFEADLTIFRTLGVELLGEKQKPRLDEDTMESNIPNLYIAGTACSGSQQAYEVFIETSHIHVARIRNHILGEAPPQREKPRLLPES
ncbi:MAG: NAD(P)-binding domain-containing protein [Candidatus Sumerlaeia bacterium]